ncbi:KipI family sensor histidine kinase inhibitor [Nocardia tenerifensis]|uniref:KipI family sensor histidine kinase inhibitor n=1 Tax=Nocardia tenerifensis TaxID=228006 RepID=A0A318K319_9NOCA|nr:allophanate hydrolase subunit 1 [Nocardia tenerifensis]PXX65681.1 KipI family sensor histidine kinase inhibitor [Nocardia tenerifensis]
MTDPAPKEVDPDRVIRAAGDCALLVLPARHDEVAKLVAALRVRMPEGVADILPAAETVLVTLLSPEHADSVRQALTTLLRELRTPAAVQGSGDVSRGTLSGNDSRDDPLEIPVRYDGADLAEVARLLGLTEAEVIAEHTGTVWHCAFVGFAPGFGYLESPDARLTVPRRPEARTSIPAGAVALAGGYTAVYPRSTPGGWHLIGTTDLRMWDVHRDPPSLIRAGRYVRFVEADRLSSPNPAGRA